MKNHNALRSLLIVVLSMGFAWNTFAQTPKSVEQSISYIRTMPREVKQLLPRGARSCFYGHFQLASTKTQFAIHLFNPSPRQGSSESNFPLHRLRLHLFEQKPNGKMRLMNNVAVHYRAMVSNPKKFAAQLLWLDPNRRTMPILKFDCFDPHGFSGLIGDYVLAVFPKGLTHKPTIQSLAYGSWNASDYGGQLTDFNEVDNKGYLQLRVTLGSFNSPDTQYLMRWNGKKFVVAWAKNPDGRTQETGIPPFP